MYVVKGEYIEEGHKFDVVAVAGALEFTGNWFIDAGILGFVNLMEEVYGDTWKKEGQDTDFLEILKNKTSNFPRGNINNLFTYAFWYKNIKDTVISWINKDNFKKKDLGKKYGKNHKKLSIEIENKLGKEIEEWNKSKSGYINNISDVEEVHSLIINFNNLLKNALKKFYSPYPDALRKIYASNKKTLLENIDQIGLVAYNSFFTNLNFFNPASNKAGNEKGLLAKFDVFIKDFTLESKNNKVWPPDPLDKRISPFVYSVIDFGNQLYSKPMTFRYLEKEFGMNPAYFILSFPYSFIRVKGKYYLFYSPSLEFTYRTNKTLKYMISSSRNGKSQSLLKITWRAIIDNLYEYKSITALENMYLISYSGIANQQIQNVEYLGISKFQAMIIIDDTLRDALNKNIPTPRKDKNKQRVWVWLLEEFVKNKPLLDHMLLYTHGLISDSWQGSEKFISKNIMITTISLDAKMKEMNIKKVYGEPIFGESFFSNYRELVNGVKTSISRVYQVSYLVQELIKDNDRKKIALNLLGRIKGNNKYDFVNELLKYVSGVSEQAENKKSLVEYLFRNILDNDISWENYAMPIVIGLVIGGGKNE